MNIDVEMNQNVATLWLNKPEVHNALNSSTLRDLSKTFKKLDSDPNVHLIFLRGRGKSFCTGADLKWMQISGSQNYIKNYRSSKMLANCFDSMYRVNKPIINLVHGNAYGGAIGFLGAADFSYATKDTSFALSELRLGLVPAIIMPYILNKITLQQARHLMLSSNVITAEEALNIGLIDGICDSEDDLVERSREMTERLQLLPVSTIGEGKKLLRRMIVHQKDAKVKRRTIKMITKMKMSPEAQRRMSKFLAKRKKI